MIIETVWMLVICWELSGQQQPVELWRVQQPTTVEACARISSLLAGVSAKTVIIVQCNPWSYMRAYP